MSGTAEDTQMSPASTPVPPSLLQPPQPAEVPAQPVEQPNAQETHRIQLEEWIGHLRNLTQTHGASGPTIRLLEELAGMPLPSPAPVPTPAPASAPAPMPVSGPLYTTKLPDLPKFSGKTDRVDMFVASMADRFALSAFAGYTDQDKVTYFSSFLSDPADLWHHSVRLGTPHLLTNYRGYVEAFRKHFEDDSHLLRVRNKFKNLRQTTSVAVYAAEFKTLAVQGHIEPLHMREAFFDGLKEEIQNDIVTQKLLNAPFEEMCTSAIQADFAKSVLMNLRARKGRNHQSNNYYSSPTPSVPSTSSAPVAPSAPALSASSSGPWPMEIDAVKARLVNGRLPQSELQRRIENGLCTYCGGSGHMKDACPKRRFVPNADSAQGKGSPRA